MVRDATEFTPEPRSQPGMMYRRGSRTGTFTRTLSTKRDSELTSDERFAKTVLSGDETSAIALVDGIMDDGGVEAIHAALGGIHLNAERLREFDWHVTNRAISSSEFVQECTAPARRAGTVASRYLHIPIRHKELEEDATKDIVLAFRHLIDPDTGLCRSHAQMVRSVQAVVNGAAFVHIFSSLSVYYDEAGEALGVSLGDYDRAEFEEMTHILIGAVMDGVKPKGIMARLRAYTHELTA
jgi:hypothetical protein